MPRVKIKRTLLGRTLVCYNCPRCGADLESTPDEVGSVDQCPACRTRFTVPGEQQLAKQKQRKRGGAAARANAGDDAGTSGDGGVAVEEADETRPEIPVGGEASDAVAADEPGADGKTPAAPAASDDSPEQALAAALSGEPTDADAAREQAPAPTEAASTAPDAMAADGAPDDASEAGESEAPADRAPATGADLSMQTLRGAPAIAFDSVAEVDAGPTGEEMIARAPSYGGLRVAATIFRIVGFVQLLLFVFGGAGLALAGLLAVGGLVEGASLLPSLLVTFAGVVLTLVGGVFALGVWVLGDLLTAARDLAINSHALRAVR